MYLAAGNDDKKKKDNSLDIAVILCIVFAIIALLLIIPIVILWVRTKRQRDSERREKLKDNDFLEWVPDTRALLISVYVYIKYR